MREALGGTFAYDADEAQSEIGRKRFHRAKGRDSSDKSGSAESGRYFVRFAFAALREPWRLTVTDAGHSDIDERDVAIASWADGVTALIAGSPASARRLPFPLLKSMCPLD